MAQPQNAPNDVRILSVVWYKVLPPHFGGQKGVALFNEHLGRLTPLLCLCSKDNEAYQTSYAVEALLPLGKNQFVNPFCWRKIYQTAKRFQATHLILEFPYHGLAGMLCKKGLGLKLVVHSHNVETLRFREQRKKRWRLLQVLEKWVLRNADAVFFKTEKDRDAATECFKIKKSKTTIVPFGVERKVIANNQAAKEILFQRHNISPETKLLLFAGTLDYKPNADAVVHLKKNLVPLLDKSGLDFEIVVCGRIVFKAFDYLKKGQQKRLRYAGNVTDVETYFAAADVFVNPVQSGGGVQTKLLEALSFGLNVVCFAGMTEGIVGAGHKVFKAPTGDWQAFANALSGALKSQSPTPDIFFEHHSWKNIAANAHSFLEIT